MKQLNALKYLLDSSGYTHERIAMVLSDDRIDENHVSASMISKYCARIKKIKKTAYIEKLEKRLKIPKEYWLDADGYTKVLTDDVKRKIDEYFRNEHEKRDLITYVDTGQHLLEREVLLLDSHIAKDRVNTIVKKIISETDSEQLDEYLLWQRTYTLLTIMEEIERIGLDNMGECIKYLKKYKSKEVKRMTIEEYEELFGKTVKEDTSE